MTVYGNLECQRMKSNIAGSKVPHVPMAGLKLIEPAKFVGILNMTKLVVSKCARLLSHFRDSYKTHDLWSSKTLIL